MNNDCIVPKPFLRWAGGKSRLLPHLSDKLPYNDFSNGHKYFEPFLGAGSLFFSLQPRHAMISDSNRDLINCYKAIKKNPILVHRYLYQLKKMNSKSFYYESREKYNNMDRSIHKAAIFIYLNKTCFNGIWRVNRNGEFNVPYGYITNPPVPSRLSLISISKALRRHITIRSADFRDIPNLINKNDFAYFDPPYPPITKNPAFTQYTTNGFTDEDHTSLFNLLKEIDENGGLFMISNADTDFIRGLFTDRFKIISIPVRRLISANGNRDYVNEVVITNY